MRSPSCPSFELPQPYTLEPHRAKLWSFPALICLALLITTLKVEPQRTRPLPSYPLSPFPELYTFPF